MERKAAPTSSQENQAPRRWPWYAALTAAYLAAASALVWLSRDSINPDGISYVQAARHYAAGRLDLAVNGWFGPMLSWLLVPACWLGVEPFLAARALGALYGVFFAWATVRLTGAIGGGRYSLWAYGAALFLSLRTVFAEVTPDFLMTAGLTWYFALAAEMIRGSSLRKAAVAGLVGGACYYAKSYALPVVMAHLLLTLIVRWVVARRSVAGGVPGGPRMGLARIAAPPVLAMGVAVVLCSPWIAIISAQFGRFTLNTSASLSSHAWLSPKANVPRVAHSANYPHFLLQQPREGRMTVWENPATAQGDWPAWPSAGLSEYWRWQWRTISCNLGEMATFLSRAELLGLLAIGTVAAMALGILGRGGGDERTPVASAALIALTFLVILWGAVSCLLPIIVVWTNDILLLAGSSGSSGWRLSTFETWALGFLISIPSTALAVSKARSPGIPRVYWIWGTLSVALYMGGYLLLYLYERFIWGTWGVLIALLASLLAYFAGGAGPAPRPLAGRKKQGAPPSSTGKTVCQVVAVIVLASIGDRLVERVYYEAANPMSESSMGAWVRQAAESFAQKGQGIRIVSNDWWKGLYFSYWSGSVFLGQYPPAFQSQEEFDAWRRDPGRDLHSFSPTDVLVLESPDRSGLSGFLRQSPGFRSVGESRDLRSGWRLTELGFDGAGPPP